jgi:hypothetical protein
MVVMVASEEMAETAASAAPVATRPRVKTAMVVTAARVEIPVTVEREAAARMARS